MRDFIEWPLPVCLVIIIFTVTILIGSIILPIARIGTRAQIATFTATIQSVRIARENKNISPLELAALQQNIIKANQWLAEIQYWNQTLFDWWIDDKVMALQPIQ